MTPFPWFDHDEVDDDHRAGCAAVSCLGFVLLLATSWVLLGAVLYGAWWLVTR